LLWMEENTMLKHYWTDTAVLNSFQEQANQEDRGNPNKHAQVVKKRRWMVNIEKHIKDNGYF